MSQSARILSLLSKGRVGAARTLCEKQCKQQPGNPDLWLLLAGVHAQSGNYESVVSCCNKILAITPSHASAQYNKGVALQALGKSAGAIDAFLKTIRLQPDNTRAFINLSLVCRALGEFENAISYAKKSIRIDKSSPDAHNCLGLALKDSGQLKQAEEALLTAIRLEPRMFRAHYNLWLVYALSGDIARGMACLKNTIKINPDYPEAYNDLGTAYKNTGELDEALNVYEKAISLPGASVSAHNNLGLLLIELGENDKAVKCYTDALKKSPDHPELNNNLGSLFYQLGKITEASEYFDRAVKAKPDYAVACCNLGNVLLEEGFATEAREKFVQAIKVSNTSAIACTGYGNACYELGQYQESVVAHKKAIEIEANNAASYISLAESLLASDCSTDCYLEVVDALNKAHNIDPEDNQTLCTLGNTFHLLGKYNDAVNVFQHVLEKDPENIDGVAGLVRAMERISDFTQAEALIRPFIDSEEFNDLNLAVAFSTLSPHIGLEDRAIKILGKAISTAADNMPLAGAYFALGKLQDSQNNYAEAFSSFNKANSLEIMSHDKEKCHDEFQACMNAFTPDKIISRVRASNRSSTPIFIVGMPRSGTTLIEQILSSHPGVYGAGELEDIEKLTVEIAKSLNTISLYPDAINLLTEETANAFAQEHLGRLSRYSGNAAHVTDKMPHNFMALGLIDILFPGCKVIHCQRDPMDTCLSIYFQKFNASHPYAANLADLGSYYREYERLMTHWHSVLRIPILDIQYEDVVEDTTKLTRELLEFCELGWDEQCLNFYESNRHVKTPSYDQVRRPVYNKSVGRWKKYSQYLEHLRKSLNS